MFVGGRDACPETGSNRACSLTVIQMGTLMCRFNFQQLSPSGLAVPARIGLCWFAVFTVAGTAMSQGTVEGEAKILTARDAWPIYITYYAGIDAGKETPVVVMLHGARSSRLVWKQTKLIEMLVQDKFAVITVDLRKHGESIAPETFPAAARGKITRVDYGNMFNDLEAVKKFLFEEHQAQRLNMRRTGLVTAGFSSVVALNWAWADWLKKPYDDAPTLSTKTPRGQDVQAILMYSAEENVTGLNVVKALQGLRSIGVASMLLYGDKNAKDKRTAVKMYKAIGGERQAEETRRIYERGFRTNARGTALLRLNLGKPSPAEFGLLFFRKHLKDLKGVNYEWRDRVSKLK